MSVTSGGTALKGLSAGGSTEGSAGSAGISITFLIDHSSPVRFHIHTEAERSLVEMTTPTKPKVLVGSCEGRSSSAICCSAPRSSVFR